MLWVLVDSLWVKKALVDGVKVVERGVEIWADGQWLTI